MFSRRELEQLKSSVELKVASMRRGMNTAREPAFKVLYEQELGSYSALHARLMKELSNEQVPEADGKGKKP